MREVCAKRKIEAHLCGYICNMYDTNRDDTHAYIYIAYIKSNTSTSSSTTKIIRRIVSTLKKRNRERSRGARCDKLLEKEGKAKKKINLNEIVNTLNHCDTGEDAKYIVNAVVVRVIEVSWNYK